jgi:hypothetical protein
MIEEARHIDGCAGNFDDFNHWQNLHDATAFDGVAIFSQIKQEIEHGRSQLS